jgi:hypothetical protein
VTVAHSWAVLGWSSETTPTLEVVSFIEVAHQGSPAQAKRATEQEPTVLNSNGLARDSPGSVHRCMQMNSSGRTLRICR